MDGYLDDEKGYQPVDKPGLRRWWKAILFSIASMVPLFWLWDRTGFPDSLGVHITAQSQAGLLENWYYSYLLLERHRLLDVVTFVYMWSVVAVIVGWIVLVVLKDRSAKQDLAPPLNTPSIFGAEEATERRRRTLIALAISLAFGALLIAILYFKGAH